jgi:hypothetical protein
VIVKNGVISAAFRDPLPIIGKMPRLRGERKGTIMVYIVDREKLKRESAEER